MHDLVKQLSENVIGFFRKFLMRYRSIYKIITGGWVLSSFMVMASTALADSNVMQSSSGRSMQFVAEQTNPWLLPEKQEDRTDFKKFPNYQGQQNQSNRADERVQGNRFVTPEILESLNQQQKQNQLMPENSPHQQYKQRQSGQGYYGYPPTGIQYSNPMYDTPAISPWGGGADTLYRGQSFPWVPNEAIGGMSPIPLSSFGDNSSLDDSANTGKQKKNNVCNPFTFIQDENFQ